MLLPPRAGSAPRRRRLYKGGHVTPGGGAHWAAPAGCYKTRRFCNAPTTAPVRPAEGPVRRLFPGQHLPEPQLGSGKGGGKPVMLLNGCRGPAGKGRLGRCESPSGAATAPPRHRWLLLFASADTQPTPTGALPPPRQPLPCFSPSAAGSGTAAHRVEEPTGSRSPAGYAARKVPFDPLVSSDTTEDYPYHPWASQLWQQRWHSPLDAGAK
ncbi:hypothetical protein Q9966_001126 [Columba livia]|nr:hypothetical protein Q9966_001126 [Columba livia]